MWPALGPLLQQSLCFGCCGLRKPQVFAHAFGEEATHGSLQEATEQRTYQGRTTKSVGQRLQWLERHLRLQWFAPQRCRDGFCGFFRHPEKYKELQANWNASWNQSSIRWFNFFRSSRSWKPARFNWCHTSRKPWAEWKDINTLLEASISGSSRDCEHSVAIGRAHLRHLRHFAYSINAQDLVLGYLAQAFHDLSLHRAALNSKLICATSNHATRPELSIPIELGSRLDGTSGMVPRWVATCQLHQLHFCVFWALVGLLLWSHVLGHERNRDQTIQLLRSTLKIFEVLPYFIVLLQDGFDLAFDHRHPVFKSHIENRPWPSKEKHVQYSSSWCSQSVRCCHTVRPWRIKMENGSSGCLLKRLVGQRTALAMRATARFPEPQSSGVMRHKIDVFFLWRPGTWQPHSTQGRRRRTLMTRNDAIKSGQTMPGKSGWIVFGDSKFAPWCVSCLCCMCMVAWSTRFFHFTKLGRTKNGMRSQQKVEWGLGRMRGLTSLHTSTHIEPWPMQSLKLDKTAS